MLKKLLKSKKIIALFIVICVLTTTLSAKISASAATSGLSTTTTITSGAVYYLRNVNSGHYLDAELSGNNNVIQYTHVGGLNQSWRITSVGSGYYTLENQDSYYQSYGRKMLSVSTVNNNSDLYYKTAGLNTQEWKIIANGDGSVRLVNRWGEISNQVLEVQDASSSSPYNVQRFVWKNISCQKWYLERIPSESISPLKTKFPQGRYWNHAGSSTNNPNGTTDTPCNHHGSCDYDGSCGCNSYSSAIQCMGFAYKLGYDTYGSDPRYWTTKTTANTGAPAYNILFQVKPGDIIRFNGHSIFVTGIQSDGVTIVYGECNYDGHCRIRWGSTKNIADIAPTFENLRVAPYVLIS